MNKKVNETRVIRIFEAFAGIGAQHKALTNIGSDSFEITKTSEWDVRAMIAYSQIHNRVEFNRQIKLITKWDPQKKFEYVNKRVFSLNSKNPGHIMRKNDVFINNVIAANIANNNFPDITKVEGKEIKDIDLITYSFPCQGLSLANMGRDKGIDDSSSTSNLVWQIHRILAEAKDNNQKMPRYLLMENVKSLIGKKYIDEYKKWKSVLEQFGYKTYTAVVSGLEHGSLQKRERVLGLSIRDTSIKWSDGEFKSLIDKYGSPLSVLARKNKYMSILESSDAHEDEIKMAIPNNTNSRKKMEKKNRNLKDMKKWRNGFENTFLTLTTKQDRHPNVGMIKVPSHMRMRGKLSSRFVTNREAYRIMGFDNKDFDAVKPKLTEGIITKDSLYRQAGNSIVVEVLESLFRLIKDVEVGKYES